MAYSSSGSSSSSSFDTEVHTCFKDCLKSFKALQKQYDQQREALNKSSLEIIGYQMGLESLEARIVVHEKNEAVYEEDIAFLKYDVQVKDISIKDFKKHQISSKDKTGLGYDSQMNESEVVHSVFNSRESEVDDSPVNDRFKTGKGFHAVPFPYTRNYMPPRPDLSFAGLDESVFQSAVRKTTTSMPETETSISKTSKDIVEKPKTVRPSAPIKKTFIGSGEFLAWLLQTFGMGNKVSYLSNYQEINGGFVAFGGSPKGGKITGKSKIRTGKLDFEDVYFVKELNTLGKFEGKADEGFLVGYSVNSKAFRFTIGNQTNGDCVGIEGQKLMQGSWDWRKHPDHEYILLPLMPSNSLLSSSTQSSDDKDTDEIPGKGDDDVINLSEWMIMKDDCSIKMLILLGQVQAMQVEVATVLNLQMEIVRYLKGIAHLGFGFLRDSPFDLEAFYDSDYARASLDRKSTTGGCQFLGKRLISWQCKKQTIVANSTTEAEYVAAANCCGQVLWIQNQMLDYGFNFMNTKIYIDNESTICIVIKIHTDQNVADLLTKAFDVGRFQYLIAKPIPTVVSSSHQKTQTPRQALKEVTELPQTSEPIPNVLDEVIYEEWDDRVGRATTTTASLDAAQASGGSPRCQEAMGVPLLRLGLRSTAGASISTASPLRVSTTEDISTAETLVIQAEEREKYFEAKKARLLAKLINQKKRYFAQQRAKERRNKPLTQAQQRTYMSNYIKHIGSHTLQQLKRLSFDELKNLFEAKMRRVGAFVPMETEIRKEVPELAARSSKRDAEEELDQRSSKRQKTSENSEPAEESKEKVDA
ncbi:hypothetical protein Tco_0459328 [Tanacetum coccineum]